jgi:tryptophanyl-tRNA synthetase
MTHPYWKTGYMQGETGKMSASDPNSAIYVTDSEKEIKNKVSL